MGCGKNQGKRGILRSRVRVVSWKKGKVIFWEGKEVELRGIKGKPGKLFNSNSMTNILNIEQRGVIVQLCSLEDPTSKSCISPDLQNVLDNHSKIFETPKGLTPIRDHDHAIYLIPGSVTPNIRPHRYPYAQRSGNSFKS